MEYIDQTLTLMTNYIKQNGNYDGVSRPDFDIDDKLHQAKMIIMIEYINQNLTSMIKYINQNNNYDNISTKI